MLALAVHASIFAQSENISKYIVNKWKIDLEEMKKEVTVKLKTEEQYQKLDGEQFDIAVEKALEKISTMQMELNADGSYIRTNSKGIAKGTWKLSRESKNLIIQTENEPEKTFQIKEINQNKLVIYTPAAGGTKRYFKSDK